MEEFTDRDTQESRWLAHDRFAWEKPEELICSLDDVVFDQFADYYDETFTVEQRAAISRFTEEFRAFCDATPQILDPKEVLKDPRWHSLRRRADSFIVAFKDKWP
jgi:hypothetical protein